MSNQQHAFFSIPELVTIIASFFSRGDLHKCIQVSTSWYNLFLPFLWSSFSHQNNKVWQKAFNDALTSERIIERDIDWFRRVFSKHVRFIRDLSITSEFLSEVILGDLTQVSSIKKTVIQQLRGLPKDDSGNPLTLSLRSLTLTVTTKKFSRGVYEVHAKLYARQCWDFICQQGCLRSLTIEKDYSVISEELHRLVASNPSSLSSLSYISFHLECKSIQFPPNVEVFAGTASWNFMEFGLNIRLREVKLGGVFKWGSLTSLMENTPSLHTLSIHGVEHFNDSDDDDDDDDGIGESPDYAQLKILEYNSSQEEYYSGLSYLLEHVPNLVSLTVKYLTSELSGTIVTKCKYIQRIKVLTEKWRVRGSAGWETGDVVRELLSSCQHLRVLDAKFLILDASEISDNGWICDNLEELHCRVTKIPNLKSNELECLERILRKESSNEILLESEEDIVGRWRLARNLKRNFFRQVSMMKSMRRLSVHSDWRSTDTEDFDQNDFIPYTSKRDGRIYLEYSKPPGDTLTMTVDDGLDELASLTSLEFLGFEYMNHGMSNEEIQWIAENIPSLKEMGGLLDGPQIGLEPDYRNKELRELMERLRGDIIHSRDFNNDG
ncbi:hypothetical protein BGZ76_002453 [Entomortierella beljakovae]|nr:hypothetical protein BGZ76_002453 [Entomortierella beljakovae]